MTVSSFRVLRRVAGLFALAALFVVWFAPRDASGTPGTVYIATDVLKAIPDDDPDGVSSTLVINDPGKVADLDLGLGISHTFVGDLEVELKHVTPNDERSAVLFGPTGCILDEINVILDDEATEFVVNACSFPPPAVGGRLRPSNALAVFDGMDIAGTWILTVRDLVGGDVGTLQGWSLDIGQAAIAFEKRVAIPSGDSSCESDDVEPLDELTISLGDEVLWCFFISNVGDVDLNSPAGSFDADTLFGAGFGYELVRGLSITGDYESGEFTNWSIGFRLDLDER